MGTYYMDQKDIDRLRKEYIGRGFAQAAFLISCMIIPVFMLTLATANTWHYKWAIFVIVLWIFIYLRYLFNRFQRWGERIAESIYAEDKDEGEDGQGD